MGVFHQHNKTIDASCQPFLSLLIENLPGISSAVSTSTVGMSSKHVSAQQTQIGSICMSSEATEVMRVPPDETTLERKLSQMITSYWAPRATKALSPEMNHTVFQLHR